MHREGMKLTGGLSISGTVEDCVEKWCTHLETTLFDHHSQKSDAFYDAMVGCWDTMVVTSCRTQAHRFYYVRCLNCNQYVYDNYDENVGKEDKIKASNKLMQFVCTETNWRQEQPRV